MVENDRPELKSLRRWGSMNALGAIRFDRLGQLAVRPGLDALFAIRRDDASSDGHDRNPRIERSRRPIPNEKSCVITIHLLHLAIHKRQALFGARLEDV